MAKQKNLYTCTACGAQHQKWSGQCSDCSAWNSLQETASMNLGSPKARFAGYAGNVNSNTVVVNLDQIEAAEEPRIATGSGELDRVLGGGLVNGSVVLIGGDPGIGKSTVLLQCAITLSQSRPVLYVTGEESLQQVRLRASRLGLDAGAARLLADTCMESILQHALKEKPNVMIIDSVQSVYTDMLQSAPGSVAQLRETTSQLVQFAKQSNTAIFLIGHVTKEGVIAGPRVLEHMVDTVLYFEGQADSRYRVIRAIKNRFGAVNEIGVFAMTEKGLKEVSNPSAIFLSRHEQPVPGSVITATREGSRPLLIELQALVDESHLSNPRRVTVGLEQNRLAMLLAVLHRHAGVAMYDQDVYVNVVGGVRVTEPAVDLAVILAALSSFRNRPVDKDYLVFGEVGLAGEIRPVQGGEERVREAVKQGITSVILPKPNMPRKPIEGVTFYPVTRLRDVLNILT